ncbi:hypothetical protein AOLI_G00220000 [Acnodon oligacanthus]
MGGCSAPNCSNSTTIGKQLFRFPKDPVRMRKWLINCRRDFVPTPCSRLCQDHFEESQFEEIARSPAGGRKLKPNAIPTLFNVPDPPSPIAPHVVPPAKHEAEKDLNVGDHGYARRQPRLDPEEEERQRAEEERPKRTTEAPVHAQICPYIHSAYVKYTVIHGGVSKAEEMKKRLHKLSKMEKGLQMFLYEDQIRALTLAKRSRRAVWSHDTVLTARKIRCAVGVKGYEFLRELGYPLPSYRTLCNRLEPKMMMTTSMQEDLAELGLGIITACNSPEGNGTSDEGLIGIMT